MFRYSKGEGQERWRLIENSPSGIDNAVAQGAHFVSVLSLDQDLERADEETKVHYKGPLYFDIDSDDEHESLADVRRLLLMLYSEYGVNLNDLIIHCTGGKGFHVLVPEKIFSSGKAQRYLPYTYKQMALVFDLANLDYGIYSAGKGRMWRIENIKRGSGRYKVKLTAAQVFGLTFDEIYQLTLSPGPSSPFKVKDVETSAELSALFRRSTFKPQPVITVADEKLQKLEDHPACIKKLLAVEEIKEGRRFNHLTLSLAGYAKGRGWSQKQLEEHAEGILEGYPSSVYKTRREKIRHLRSIYGYVASSQAYSFSCQNIRRTVACELSDCPNCPIEIQASKEDYDPTMGIEVSNNCYFRRTETGRSQVTTFVIVPESIIEFVDSMEGGQYTINTTLVADNKHRQPVVFTQPDWGSKSALIKRLPHPDFAYLGGDTDVQRLFKVVAGVKVPKKTGVRVIGLHKVKGDWHFVSKEGSISGGGQQDELLLETDYMLPTKLISETEPSMLQMRSIMSNLFAFNIPEVTVPLIGWFAASFHKERIFELTRQFPLLFIFGAAGAGKTQTVLNLKRMFCLETDHLRSIADVTAFTLIKSANANNTVPLILDEYKSTTFSAYQVKMVSKLIRAAYNNEAGERGTASQQIRTYYYRSPIILAGEQTVTEPAARDRIIEVHMNKVHSAPHLEQFMELQKAPLEKLGKLLLTQALTIPTEELAAMLEDCKQAIPECYTDRPRLNQAIIMLGMRLLARAVKKYGVDDTVNRAWDTYLVKSQVVQKEDLQESMKSDVDRVLEAICLMSDADERYKLAKEWEYVVEDDKLYINLRLVYTRFLKFAGEYSIDADAMNYTSFLKLIKKEPYFVRDSVPKKLKQGTKLCIVLNIPKLQAKGLNLLELLEDAAQEEAGELKLD